jgi:TM2 domain-containing membrane protein YozV
MSLICPYCRGEFAEGEEAFPCPTCATPHHSDCFDENGGCTVFGCSSAPSDEPKINISSNELVSVAGAPASSASVSLPPPPPFVGFQAQPSPPPPLSESSPAPSYGFSSFGGYPLAPADASIPPGYYPRKDRVAFVLFAVFLGSLGVHNFYAGYTKRAVIQCCLTVFTCFIASPATWVWAIVEACVVTQDDDGIAFN